MYFKNQNSYFAAVYLRLSRDDGDKAESDSIRNQRSLLRDFINQQNDMTFANEYIDDGYSGANFERPGFQQMMKDAKENKFNCIIVKDLSRLGRNYIETGRYLERTFPMLGIRFIAVNDHYDSADTKNDADQIIVPFKNLINDAYCRDISMKIRSQFDVKRKQGKFISSYACYGYKKDPEDKNHLVIDDYAAEIVRMIFHRKMEGFSANSIAEELTEMGVLIPTEYKRSCGIHYINGFRSGKNPKWEACTVIRILKNELYTGTMVQGKTRKINYKVKASQKIEPENWIRVEGTHEPIVSREVFETVQRLMTFDTRTSPNKECVYVFSGLLRCGSCGQNMVRRCVKKNGKSYFYYHCSTYKRGEGCSSHNISDVKLQKAVLEAIQSQIALVIRSDEILSQMETARQQQFGVKTLDVQIKALHKEIKKYEELKDNLYEDMTDGVISREEYREIKQTFSKKMETAKNTRQELEEKRKRMMSGEMNTPQWVEEFKKYQNIQTLNRKVVIMLIEKIVVHSADRIEIHFNYQDEIAEFVECAMVQEEKMDRKVGNL